MRLLVLFIVLGLATSVSAGLCGNLEEECKVVPPCGGTGSSDHYFNLLCYPYCSSFFQEYWCAMPGYTTCGEQELEDFKACGDKPFDNDACTNAFSADMLDCRKQACNSFCRIRGFSEGEVEGRRNIGAFYQTKEGNMCMGYNPAGCPIENTILRPDGIDSEDFDFMPDPFCRCVLGAGDQYTTIDSTARTTTMASTTIPLMEVIFGVTTTTVGVPVATVGPSDGRDMSQDGTPSYGTTTTTFPPYDQDKNYCGPEGMFSAPSGHLLSEADFNTACYEHDKCYSECLVKPKNTQTYCDGQFKRMMDNSCDQEFDRRMNECEKKSGWNPLRYACIASARVRAVTCWGQSRSYHGIVIIGGKLIGAYPC